MTRPNEINCLNRVREAFSRAFIAPKCFCNVDLDLVRSMFNSAKECPNDPPDFCCKDGFIEHFEVSPSKEGDRGSEFRKKKSKADKERKAQFDQCDLEFLASQYEPRTFRIAPVENVYEDFSYDAFLLSLQKNVSSHIERLKKRELTGLTSSAFMAENAGARLYFYERGVLRGFYAIHSDRKALEILRLCIPFVRLFIFVAEDSIEILDLTKLDELISKALDSLDVRGGRFINLSLKMYMDS